jgi:hypothetical protein
MQKGNACHGIVAGVFSLLNIIRIINLQINITFFANIGLFALSLQAR